MGCHHEAAFVAPCGTWKCWACGMALNCGGPCCTPEAVTAAWNYQLDRWLRRALDEVYTGPRRAAGAGGSRVVVTLEAFTEVA